MFKIISIIFLLISSTYADEVKVNLKQNETFKLQKQNKQYILQSTSTLVEINNYKEIKNNRFSLKKSLEFLETDQAIIKVDGIISFESHVTSLAKEILKHTNETDLESAKKVVKAFFIPVLYLSLGTKPGVSVNSTEIKLAINEIVDVEKEKYDIFKSKYMYKFDTYNNSDALITLNQIDIFVQKLNALIKNISNTGTLVFPKTIEASKSQYICHERWFSKLDCHSEMNYLFELN